MSLLKPVVWRLNPGANMQTMVHHVLVCGGETTQRELLARSNWCTASKVPIAGEKGELWLSVSGPLVMIDAETAVQDTATWVRALSHAQQIAQARLLGTTGTVTCTNIECLEPGPRRALAVWLRRPPTGVAPLLLGTRSLSSLPPSIVNMCTVEVRDFDDDGHSPSELIASLRAPPSKPCAHLVAPRGSMTSVNVSTCAGHAV